MSRNKDTVTVYRRPRPVRFAPRWPLEDDSTIDPRFELLGSGGINVKSSDPIERVLDEVA